VTLGFRMIRFHLIEYKEKRYMRQSSVVGKDSLMRLMRLARRGGLLISAHFLLHITKDKPTSVPEDGK